MKYILSSQPTLLIGRHIGQLILCAIYGVCKVFRHSIKFQEIITKYLLLTIQSSSSIRYQDLPFFSKEDFNEVIRRVYINDNESSDLIKFYNSNFIVPTKAFLFSLAQGNANQPSTRPATPQIAKPLIPSLVTASPLREFLPAKSINSGMPTPDRRNTPLQKIGLTPKTKALYAFGESPYMVLDSINKFSNKRALEYNDGDNLPGSAIRKQVKTPNSTMNKPEDGGNNENGAVVKQSKLF